MSKIFKPRRILKSKAASLNPILTAGEMIIEVPDTGVGTGPCIMKIGDGKTAYVDLPISMGGTADNIVYSGAVDGTAVTNVKLALDNLISKYNSFNDAKSKIIASALGKVLGMTSTTTLDSAASLINGVVNRGDLNWSDSNTTATVSAGYYTGGTLDSRTSYNNGYSSGNSAGYSSGRSQGQSDVTGNPNGYGLYTKSQYDANYNSGRSQGQSDVTGNPNGYGLYSKSQYDSNWSGGYNSGYSAGNSAGYNNGYNAGRTSVSYATIIGTSSGAQTMDTNTVTVPSGKSVAYVVAGITNPKEAETYVVANGSAQGKTEYFTRTDVTCLYSRLDLWAGCSVYVHSRRQNTSKATCCAGIVLFS